VRSTMSNRRIAVLIDGGFFLKRLPRLVSPGRCDGASGIAKCITELCRNHIRKLTGDEGSRWIQHLYRTFFYDALPYDGTAHHPIENRLIQFGKSDLAGQRLALFETLRKQRKLALRLGKVTRQGSEWSIDPRLTKKMLRMREWMAAIGPFDSIMQQSDPISLSLTREQALQLVQLQGFWQGLERNAVSLNLRQKGVDMRIGIDIASLALKRQVDTIVLVAGDSDFVPAAKLARREGIDFILDPLWQDVNDDLHEHIDGLQSGLPKPTNTPTVAAASAPLVPTTDPEQANGP